MNKKIIKKHQAGFTLVELGIVVAIAAVIIGIGLAVVPSIVSSIRANGEVSDLPTLSTKIRTAWANQPTYGTSGTSITTEAISLNVFPTARVTSSTTVSNRWGGSITVAAGTLNTAGDAQVITETDVPQTECTLVVEGVDQSFPVITVNGTSVKANGASQVTLATVGTACVSGTNTLAFTAGK